ncbi:Hypothetical protein, putative [Bodo saltans]|uniref:Uncharacterized protein n=1 Tax=Bodo saltans TaxID=75058 RepID=A0A0S4ILW3_BODSA|nr:Hypothetical protein, putative [Bodo saltans]|eukprot:CUF33964.1 Hypothetical protein, putative [Bodo saltans]
MPATLDDNITTSCQNKAAANADSTVNANGRQHKTYVCEGDKCFPVRKIREEEENHKFDVQAECQQWQEFSPASKKLFGAGRVWVLCSTPCAGKIICEPFHMLMEKIKSIGSSSSSNSTTVAGGGSPGRTSPSNTEPPRYEEDPAQLDAAILLAARTAPWSYPRINFQTDAHMEICEKALSIYGRTPFIGLIDMPNSSAFILDLSQPAPCVKADRKVEVFKLISNHQIRDFAINAIIGRWPKALLGETPPPEDIDPLTTGALKATFKAVQSTLPRLVRGEVRTVHEAKRLERLSNELTDQHHRYQQLGTADNNDTRTKDRFRAGATGSGPLLCLLTLWAPRCPCCPPLIRMLDSLTDMITSSEFKERFPACPLFAVDATFRNVTLDVDRNDLEDHEWPAASEALEPLASPSLGATTNSEQLPEGFSLGTSPPSPAMPDVPGDNSARGHPERALPTKKKRRDDKQ